MKKPSNKIKQIITCARQIPASVYHLFFINLVLFIGLVIRQLSILYILGCLILAVLLITFIGVVFKVYPVPESFLSQNISQSIEEVQNNMESWIKKLNVLQLGSSNISTIVTVLVIVYVSAVLNQTLEIFIVFNLVFCSVFLPHETQGILGLIKQNAGNILEKIKYHERI